jgi:hypothetical protein
MPRADNIATRASAARVATPKETICLIEGRQPFDRGIEYANGALPNPYSFSRSMNVITSPKLA